MAIHHLPKSSYPNHDHDHDHHRNNFSVSSKSNPLFSSVLTLYLLILLYFPHLFFTLVLSPLFFFTLILLHLLLRFCSSQQTNRASNDLNRVKTARIEADREPVEAEVKDQARSQCRETPTEPHPQPKSQQQGSRAESGRSDCPKHAGVQPESSPVWDPNPIFREKFVEWGVGAPLEVIYETYEGEEEGNEYQNGVIKEECTVRLGMLPSPSWYYPKSDWDLDSETNLGSESGSSLSSLDGEFHGIQRWVEKEEEREGLIEIDLHHGDVDRGTKKPLELSPVDEEDNLIEIDISRTELILGFPVDRND